MKKITALLYIFIFIFTSCKEEVEYEDLGVKNIIVINGRFIDGETPWCQVSRSDIIFEQTKTRITPTTYLPDANVTASEGSSEYKYTVVADNAMMEAKDLIAKAGETYTLKAKANGLDDVYSTISVPSKPKADFKLVSVDTLYTHGHKVTYELNIQDDPNTEDYYQIILYSIKMQYKYEYGIVDTVDGYWMDSIWIPPHEVYGLKVVDSAFAYYKPYELLQTEDPVMNWNQNQTDNILCDYPEENEMSIFNDRMFNGQTSKIKFYMYIFKEEPFIRVDIDSLEYEVRHINKEMYMYYRTYQLIMDNDQYRTNSPHMLYCNVENGAGLIAAWSAVKKPLKLPDQVK
ncbi:MAG: DUF4249 family protein [Paludibacteraceae bacterium]|nr:DUF4249 family protein [Paludibacteraceae bacterium]